MIAFAFALAALLTTDKLPAKSIAPIATELHVLGVAVELLDQRELRYWFHNSAESETDWVNLRKRLKDLDGSPHLIDGAIFSISRDDISTALELNRKYRFYLQELRDLHPHLTHLQLIQAETEYLYQVWDLLRDAKTEYYYTHVRREALRKLREKIGPEAFRRGELPPMVPVWRFAVVR